VLEKNGRNYSSGGGAAVTIESVMASGQFLAVAWAIRHGRKADRFI
jgi:hypothetical protein